MRPGQATAQAAKVRARATSALLLQYKKARTQEPVRQLHGSSACSRVGAGGSSCARKASAPLVWRCGCHRLSPARGQALRGKRARRLVGAPHAAAPRAPTMVKLTMIARLSDGLPLAEGLDSDKDQRELEQYKQQAKNLFKKLGNGPGHQAPRMSFESGPFTLQYVHPATRAPPLGTARPVLL